MIAVDTFAQNMKKEVDFCRRVEGAIWNRRQPFSRDLLLDHFDKADFDIVKNVFQQLFLLCVRLPLVLF